MTQQAFDMIDYDNLVENSLRYVIKQALGIVENNGLPGDHHFYITFLTRFEGVEIPETLLKIYPKEMTIVIQHQFYDLKVNNDSFSVTLSFNNLPHNLTIPYDAVTYFADPHAKFGLRFNTEYEDEEKNDSDDLKDSDISAPEAETEEDDSAKVVALDAFRKK